MRIYRYHPEVLKVLYYSSYHSHLLGIDTSINYGMTGHHFYLFTVTFNVVERPRIESVPVLGYVIAAINGRSLNSVIFFLRLKVKNRMNILGVSC